MNEDIIEIDQIEDGHVVLVIPSLRLIVMGRTLEEARAWARSAIACRGLSTSQRHELSARADEVAEAPELERGRLAAACIGARPQPGR